MRKKSGFRGRKNKTKQNVVEFKERRGGETGWWHCHGDQTPTSVAYNGRGSRQAFDDNYFGG